ncbi:MAG: aspartate-semialdehyde dehydrogenase [Chloroflexi bacterium]|nr:aspartate-semialdehyde dehydrogenase [Chloroflexota bacterium]
MRRELNVALVGATGLVGQEILKILEERKFPVAELRLCASDRSAGRRLFFNHRELSVHETGTRTFERMELVLFAAGREVASHYAHLAARAGAVVIDYSPAFRLEAGVPLVVPEVNAEDLKGHEGIIANPESTVTQLVMVLNSINRINPVRRAVVASYLAVSGAGAAAQEELTVQIKQVQEGRAAMPHIFPHQIAFNVLPQCDVFLDNGYTRDEWELVEESRKVLHAPELALAATCVRVPVHLGHGQAVHLELAHPMSAEDARKALAEAPGVRVLDDPHVSLYPTPWSAAGQDSVFVGRIRQDTAFPNGLALWIVADNVRKGAALNAIQIAEELLARELV